MAAVGQGDDPAAGKESRADKNPDHQRIVINARDISALAVGIGKDNVKNPSQRLAEAGVGDEVRRN